MDDTTVKDNVGAANYELVRSSMKPFFPGGEVSDQHVDGVVLAAWSNYHAQHAAIGIPPRPADGIFNRLKAKFEAQVQVAAPSEAHLYPLYLAQARHHRTVAWQSTTPFESEFVIHTPYVRVQLPEALPADGRDVVVTTVVGEVRLKTDHLVGSLAMIAEKYGDAAHAGYAPARVDLITTPRYGGTRYAGAVGIYLCYKNVDDPAPSFFLLEGGLATGEPQVIYFGETMDTIIVTPSFYQVTPFAHQDHLYHGTLTMSANDPDEPDTLTIKAFHPGQQEPYLVVENHLVRQANIKPTAGAIFFTEAALRIALIGNGMGTRVFGLPKLAQDASAEAGEHLYSWVTRPPYVPVRK